MPSPSLNVVLNYFEKYKKWVTSNPQLVGDIESTVKWLSYFTAGWYICSLNPYRRFNLILFSTTLSFLHRKDKQFDANVRARLFNVKFARIVQRQTYKCEYANWRRTSKVSVKDQDLVNGIRVL